MSWTTFNWEPLKTGAQIGEIFPLTVNKQHGPAFKMSYNSVMSINKQHNNVEGTH